MERRGVRMAWCSSTSVSSPRLTFREPDTILSPGGHERVAPQTAKNVPRGVVERVDGREAAAPVPSEVGESLGVLLDETGSRTCNVLVASRRTPAGRPILAGVSQDRLYRDQQAKAATEAVPAVPRTIAESPEDARADVIVDRALGFTLDDLVRAGNHAFNHWLKLRGSATEPSTIAPDIAGTPSLGAVEDSAFAPQELDFDPVEADADIRPLHTGASWWRVLRQQTQSLVVSAVMGHVEAESQKGGEKVLPENALSFARQAIPLILQACIDQGVRDVRHVAYILATAQHETHFGAPKYKRSTSLIEDSNPYTVKNGVLSAHVHTGKGGYVAAANETELYRKYWEAAYGGRRDLGNDKEGDGATYLGRGYVQLTGKGNYDRMSKRLNQVGFSYTHKEATYGGRENHMPINLVQHPERACPDLRGS